MNVQGDSIVRSMSQEHGGGGGGGGVGRSERQMNSCLFSVLHSMLTNNAGIASLWPITAGNNKPT